MICDALTREVVRVHKQLQQAAATLKGPAQLPALQAWDTAFAKVRTLPYLQAKTQAALYCPAWACFAAAPINHPGLHDGPTPGPQFIATIQARRG